MFKLYSKGCEYTIRALMFISSLKEDERFSPKDVCKKANIPESYTRKIFQALVQEGLFDAVTGPGGGYKLTEDPRNITILRIIKAVDGEETFDRCIMGLSECNDSMPCPIHKTWKKLKHGLSKELSRKTLRALMDVKERRSKRRK